MEVTEFSCARAAHPHWLPTVEYFCLSYPPGTPASPFQGSSTLLTPQSVSLAHTHHRCPGTHSPDRHCRLRVHPRSPGLPTGLPAPLHPGTPAGTRVLPTLGGARGTASLRGSASPSPGESPLLSPRRELTGAPRGARGSAARSAPPAADSSAGHRAEPAPR